jgi:hypothetical protein
LKPIIESKIFQKEDLKKIFGNIEEILAINEEFFSQLKRELNNYKGEVFICLQQPILKVYTEYYLNYQVFSTFLKKQFTTNESYKELYIVKTHNNPRN